jgi:aspartate racemase
MVQRRLVGVLGGMGPLATVDFMQKVIEATPAARDQDHIPLLIRSFPQVPDRAAAIFEGRDEPFAHLLDGVRALAASGVELIVMPCNTAHAWYDRLAASIEVPFLHIADAVAAVLGTAPPQPVAVMATAATVRVGFYQRYLSASGRKVVVPNADVQRVISDAIQAVKVGDLTLAKTKADDAAEAILNLGAERLLLACTELPLAFRSSHYKTVCLDATACLATATVAFACRAEDALPTLAEHG